MEKLREEITETVLARRFDRSANISLIQTLASEKARAKFAEVYVRMVADDYQFSQSVKDLESFIVFMRAREPGFIRNTIEVSVQEAVDTIKDSGSFRKIGRQSYLFARPYGIFSIRAKLTDAFEEFIDFLPPALAYGLVSVIGVFLYMSVEFQPLKVNIDLNYTNIPAYIAIFAALVTALLGAVWVFGDD